MKSKAYCNTSISTVGSVFFLSLALWLLTRSKPHVFGFKTRTTGEPDNISISSELTTLSDRLSVTWISMRDKILRKSSSRHLVQGYGFEFKEKSFHLFLCILLAGDIATNLGPVVPNSQSILSFNAQSLCSINRRQDGSFISNLNSFQNLVYAEDFDIIAITETRLNNNVYDSEILPLGYNIIRNYRPFPQRGGGVLLALREGIEYDRVSSGSWADKLEILAIEIKTRQTNKCLLCVCYRPPANCDLREWLDLFTSFLLEAEKYEKVIITGDFNFPQINWGLE